MIPFLLAAILFSYFGLQRRRWQQGGATTDDAGHTHRSLRPGGTRR